MRRCWIFRTILLTTLSLINQAVVLLILLKRISLWPDTFKPCHHCSQKWFENGDISENDTYEDSGSSYVTDEDDFEVEAHLSNSEAIQMEEEEEHKATNNDEIKKLR